MQEAELEARARRLLAEAPRPPADVGRFTSNARFGQPGIYPDGPPMAPATGPPLVPSQIDAELDRMLGTLHAEVSLPISDERLISRVDEPALRAALVLLGTTVAAPALDAHLERDSLPPLRYGVPASPGRVLGPPADAAHEDAAPIVNERYRAEHFALVTPSLAHALLHDPTVAGQFEEAFLHALLAMVHLQLLAAFPELGEHRTELARRQHSLAITLFNSRRPHDDRIRLIAPDGPGTIPGGDPALQSPDFWSIPFASGAPTPSPAPAALAGVLERVAAPAKPALPSLRFDDDLARWFDEHQGRDWLTVRDQLRAGIALGLLEPDDEMREWAERPDRGR